MIVVVGFGLLFPVLTGDDLVVTGRYFAIVTAPLALGVLAAIGVGPRLGRRPRPWPEVRADLRPARWGAAGALVAAALILDDRRPLSAGHDRPGRGRRRPHHRRVAQPQPRPPDPPCRSRRGRGATAHASPPLVARRGATDARAGRATGARRPSGGGRPPGRRGRHRHRHPPHRQPGPRPVDHRPRLHPPPRRRRPSARPRRRPGGPGHPRRRPRRTTTSPPSAPSPWSPRRATGCRRPPSDRRPLQDLQVALRTVSGGGGAVVVEIFVVPMAQWVWWGALLVALGIGLSTRRGQRRDSRPVEGAVKQDLLTGGTP